MKESSTPFELFEMGLRPENLRQLGKPGLVSCYGFRLADEGLESFPSATAPIVAAEGAMDWPFPQLFRFSGTTYLLTRHYLYTVASDWSLTQGPAWFHSGEIWDGLDFGNFRVFCNGTVNILNDPSSGDFRFATALEFPVNATACNFKGQIIIGNISEGTNWIKWSSIGANEWTITRSNEAGQKKMEWDGDVLRIKSLEKIAVVYGDSGITILSPVSAPTTTFGFETAAYYGIASKGAVCDGAGSHLFIDEGGTLRRLSPRGIEKLGFKEFFQPMLGTDIVILFNPLEEEYYISNSLRSFVLSKKGLTEIDECYSGGAVFDGQFVGVKSVYGNAYRTLVSNPFNMGFNATKTITWVGLNTTDASGVQVAIDWRYAPTEVFQRSPFFPVNKEGVSEPVVEAVEFRLVIRVPASQAPDYSGQVMVGWKATDKRFLRGYHVPAKSNG